MRNEILCRLYQEVTETKLSRREQCQLTAGLDFHQTGDVVGRSLSKQSKTKDRLCESELHRLN